MQKTLLWFRQDLRLADHPALFYAAQAGQVLPIYILDTVHTRPLGGASQWWLHHSLKSLAADICKTGAKLHFFVGDPQKIIPQLCKEHALSHVYWSRCYEPEATQRDKALKKTLKDQGFIAESFNASLLHEPWEIKPKTSDFYKVFTPYWGACLKALEENPPLSPPPQPTEIQGLDVPCIPLEALGLQPKSPNWAKSFKPHWNIGEKAAFEKLREFCDHRIDAYHDNRNLPAVLGTSRLSPHLHFGELSPRQIYHHLHSQMQQNKGVDTFMSEIGWREFGYHLLYHIADFAHKPWKQNFNHFQWDTNPTALKQWQQGQTGYPIVDAGMRELWQTGFMHNRVRMIAASFLIKDLFIHWKKGEEWFWDTLVDADLANNVAGWQWVAGSGADASPYFRIFNPTSQGEKFDPHGHYIRKYVPELANLPNEYIHAPLQAPTEVLLNAGVILGKTYPKPIVNHAAARTEALARYKAIAMAK